MGNINWPTVPYPGLRPFGAEGHPDEELIFFGRDPQVLQLLERLYDHRFLAVLGPSGCGKSSLVRVGLVPRLEAGYLTNAGPLWASSTMEPGTDPVGSLARAWGQICSVHGVDSDEATIAASLRAKRSGLLDLATNLESHAPPNANAILVVDQFEEIFRRDLCDSTTAAHFVDLLLHVHYQRPGRVYIVLTMRTDYIDAATFFPGLPDALNQSLYLVPNLSASDIEESIRRPLQLPPFRCAIEDELVARLLREVPEHPLFDQDRLALLQYGLARLWELVAAEGPKRTLTLSHYSQLSGRGDASLATILSDTANRRLADLPKNQADIARTMLLLMVNPRETGSYSRRLTTLEEITKAAGSEEHAVKGALQTFTQGPTRFVRLRGNGQYDLVHESLIRQWDRLKSWSSRLTSSAAELRRLAELEKRDASLTWREYSRWNSIFRQQRPVVVDALGFDSNALAGFLSRTRRAKWGRLALFGVAVIAIVAYFAGQLVQTTIAKEFVEGVAQVQGQKLEEQRRILRYVDGAVLANNLSTQHPGVALDIALFLHETSTSDNEVDEVGTVSSRVHRWIEEPLTRALVQSLALDRIRITVGTHVQALKVVPKVGSEPLEVWIVTGAWRTTDFPRLTAPFSRLRFHERTYSNPVAEDVGDTPEVLHYSDFKSGREPSSTTINAIDWHGKTGLLLSGGNGGFVRALEFDPLLGKWDQKARYGTAPIHDLSVAHDGTYFAWAGTRRVQGRYSVVVGVVGLPPIKSAGAEFHADSGSRVQPAVRLHPTQDIMAVGSHEGVRAFLLERKSDGIGSGREEIPLQLVDSLRSATVSSLEWSPDGARLAVGTSGGLVYIYGFDSHRTEIQLPSGTSFSAGGRSVQALAWAPGGNYLAAGTEDSRLKVWDVATGSLELTLLMPSRVSSIDWEAATSSLFLGMRSGSIDRVGNNGYVYEIPDRLITGTLDEKANAARDYLNRIKDQIPKLERAEVCAEFWNREGVSGQSENADICSVVYGSSE